MPAQKKDAEYRQIQANAKSVMKAWRYRQALKIGKRQMALV